MVYFNFNYVTDPPNDELVDPITQLNDNFIELDTKIKGFNTQPNTVVNPPVGTEALYSGGGEEHRIAVWNGIGWYRNINPLTTWVGWQNLNLLAPVVERNTTFTPKYDSNYIQRRIIFSGGVLFNSSADPWPTGTTVRITATGAIHPDFAPADSKISYQTLAVGQISAANGFAMAQAIVDGVTDPSDVRISIRYQGDAGGGNFVMLDGLSWWY